ALNYGFTGPNLRAAGVDYDGVSSISGSHCL
ncbi:MAG: hypothetical protein EBR87_10355, partial [Cytophagia bacterium]|nr:hypothetical protein [Cytophagia bacterium]